MLDVSGIRKYPTYSESYCIFCVCSVTPSQKKSKVKLSIHDTLLRLKYYAATYKFKSRVIMMYGNICLPWLDADFDWLFSD